MSRVPQIARAVAGRDRQAGFVLLNALILVAALAGVAVLLLGRAGGAMARQEAGRDAAQLRLYLDAAEALALTRLARDRQGGEVDAEGEDWARPEPGRALDRGRVSLALTDLTGRFNVNWLADPGDAFAQEGFVRLTARRGLSGETAKAVVAFLSPDGAGGVGGPVLTLDQLRRAPGLAPRDLDRLMPVLAALPVGTTLNLNTAPAEVLQSLLPGASPAVVQRFVQVRASTPFASTAEALEALAVPGAGAGEAGAGLDETRFAVGSRWFGLTAEAELGDRRRRRSAVIERPPFPAALHVLYRVETAQSGEAG